VAIRTSLFFFNLQLQDTFLHNKCKCYNVKRKNLKNPNLNQYKGKIG